MVKELMEEIPNGGVSGGGHLVVGSIKFVGGMRKEVLAKLAEKISGCPADQVISVVQKVGVES
jgi:archaea-specific RecJ-like exonuclease